MEITNPISPRQPVGFHCIHSRAGDRVAITADDNDDGGKRRLRKSDPTPPTRMSANMATPTPLRRASGWDYPMSREEKKHRVLCLYEAECAQAQKSNDESLEALMDENEALQAQLDQKSHWLGGVLESMRNVLSNIVTTASSRDHRILWISSAVILCFVALILVGSMIATARAAATGASLEQRALATPDMLVASSSDMSGHVSLSTPEPMPNMTQLEKTSDIPSQEMTPPLAAVAGPPDVGAAIRRMRTRGLERLRVSDCVQAEWYFTNALRMIDELPSNVDIPPPVSGAKPCLELACLRSNTSSFAHTPAESTQQLRSRLVGDRGFALVCAQRYDDAATALGDHLLGDTGAVVNLYRGPLHLVNALGLALFRLQDYTAASAAFEMGTKVDASNAILWNNLGAARMVKGDISGADDALYQAVDLSEPAKRHPFVEEYHHQLFLSNVANLVNFANKNAQALPGVELWWGGDLPSSD